MKLTEQLQEWNENDEYQKIIDAIEGCRLKNGRRN